MTDTTRRIPLWIRGTVTGISMIGLIYITWFFPLAWPKINLESISHQVNFSG